MRLDADPRLSDARSASRGSIFSGVYRVGIFGGLVVGAPIGGVLARTFGITAPFWFGFVGSAILVALLWREFALIAHDDEAAPATA